MNYLFKLARRTARLRMLPLVALASALAGCDADRLTGNSDTPPASPASQPTVGPLALFSTTSFRGGMPFGTYALPTEEFGAIYNGALRNIWPEQLLSELATIKARGGKVFLMFAGQEDHYKDAQGHFDLGLWKARIDRFRGIDFSSYVADGTVMGHYLIDEPYDPFNWNGQPVPGATLETMAQYSKGIWPKMLTVVRAQPNEIQWNGTYHYLDAAWAQYTSAKGDVNDYIRKNVSDAKTMGLGLVAGLNMTKGGPNKSKMTASQIDSWGSAMLTSSYPCAFLNWEYDQPYMQQTDIKAALTHLSQKAATLTSHSCAGGADSTPPIPLPGVKGIALQAARALQNGAQLIRLTWVGGQSTRVDIYQDGVFRRTTVNDGRASVYPHKPARYVYKLCEAGTSKCSNTAAATIR
jgi:hypothetical protein